MRHFLRGAKIARGPRDFLFLGFVLFFLLPIVPVNSSCQRHCCVVSAKPMSHDCPGPEVQDPLSPGGTRGPGARHQAQDKQRCPKECSFQSVAASVPVHLGAFSDTFDLSAAQNVTPRYGFVLSHVCTSTYQVILGPPPLAASSFSSRAPPLA